MRRAIRLLLLALCLLLTLPAHAQDAGVAGLLASTPATGAAAAGLGPSLSAPPSFDNHIFSTIYDKLLTPIKGSVTGIEGALASWVATWMMAGCSVLLIILAIAAIMGNEQAYGWLIGWGLRCGALVLIAATASGYQQWVSQPLLQLPIDLGNSIASTTGAPSMQAGGALFDQIFAQIWLACDVAVRAVSFGSITGIATGIIICLAALAVAAVGSWILVCTFCIFITISAILYLLIGMGPIFVASILFVVSRWLFEGWLKAIASQIFAQLVIFAVLAILTQIIVQELGTITSQGANADPVGVLISLVQIAGILLVSFVMSGLIEVIAIGTVGGVMASIGPPIRQRGAALIAAGGRLMGSADGAATPTSGGTAGGSASPAPAPAHWSFPGPSLSSRRSP